MQHFKFENWRIGEYQIVFLMRNQGYKWTLKTNDANQANTYLRSNYPEEVVTRRHRVRASQGCLARIVELDQRSQFKTEKTQARKPE